MPELIPISNELEVVETAEGTALCFPDGRIAGWLNTDEDVDDEDRDDFDDAYCDICGDTGPWVDTATGLCEMCWDQHGDEEDYDEDDSYD